MERKFNTKLVTIKSIGDELRFQREYYNFKNSSKKYTPKIYKGRKSIYLGEALKEFLNNNFEYMQDEKYDDENKGEYGANETMLYDIEHNRIRASKEKDCGKYNIDSYYLRIYSLFKIYGFLDDYEIIMLLDKYNITPKFKQSETEIKKIKEKCFSDYKENSKKRAFKINDFRLEFSPTISEQLIEKLDELKITFTPRELNTIKTRGRFHNCCKRPQEIMIDSFMRLSAIEKKCLSLEIGKETSFIDNILKNNIEYVTLETVLKIINNIEELKNTDFEYIIKRKSEINNGYNQKEIEKDLFDFRKKWGV